MSAYRDAPGRGFKPHCWNRIPGCRDRYRCRTCGSDVSSADFPRTGMVEEEGLFVQVRLDRRNIRLVTEVPADCNEATVRRVMEG